MPSPDKPTQIAHIEQIERGDADGPALAAAWRAAKTLQLNLRTRMRRAIARSASLPPKLAAEVLPRFPAEVWENPALPLLLMESPDLLQRAPARFWDEVFASPEVSPALLPALVAGCPLHRLGMLARRPEFDAADAPAMLQRLRRDVFVNETTELDLTDAQCLALCRQWHEPMLDLDPALLAALRRQTQNPSVRHMLMRARQLTATEALALIPTAMARQYPESLALAGRDDLPPALINEFLAREPGPVRAKVCANPKLPAETLAGLVTDRNPLVSAVALLHPALPRAAWARVLTRGTAVRRAVLAARPDLLPEEYDLLAQAGEAQVRLAIAQNPRVPTAVLARLQGDLVDEVREALAQNPQYVPEATAPQGDPSPAAPATKRARAPKPTALDAARKLLVGDTSGGVKWEPALQWVEHGGERPERMAMSAQDRRKVLRAGLKVLGDDLTAGDPQRERLLVVLINGLGCLPELNSRAHHLALTRPIEGRAQLAEQWMTRLQRAGFSEAQALALLCFTRTSVRLGRGQGITQQQLAALALGARGDRAIELLHAVPKGTAREHFAEDLAELTGAAAPSPEVKLGWLVALYEDPVARAAMKPEHLRRLAIQGGMALLRALEARDAPLARTFLRNLDLRSAWHIPPEMLTLAREAQGLK
jgi:hypothetical protein